MAKRSTPVDKTPIDPLFGIPLGAEGQFVFSRENSDVEEEVTEFEEVSDTWLEFDEEGNPIDFDDGFDDQDGTSIASPEVFTIVSQRLRRGPGGQQVVDIVLNAEDVAGAVNYEIQVVKL